jgi:RNA polymerase sigma-70 factor (ECF subfamily)
MNENKDKVLVRNCLNGDPKSFEILVERYQKTVFNAIYRLVNRFEDAEDITQTVFIKVYENLERYNPNYKFYSWIYRIALNESINFIASRKREQDLVEDYISRDQNPEEQYTQSETDIMIQNALQQLDYDYRVLIVLKHFLDRSYQDMARIMDLPEKKIKSRLYVARQKLACILSKKGIKTDD